MKKNNQNFEIPSQKKLINSVKNVPIEFFKWGQYPDHFKIDLPHRHVFSELLFFTKGGGIHEIDFVDNNIDDYAIHFIPKSIVHFLKRDISSDGFTIALDTIFLETNDIHKFILPFNFEPFILNLDERNFKEVLQITEIINTQVRMSSGFYKEKCFLLAVELLLNKLGSLKDKFGRHSNLLLDQDELLRKFNLLLKTYIHKEHSVSWYASELNITASSFSNHCKKKNSKSPKRMITEALLKSVKYKLLNANMSNKQIALTHNFTESSLGKLFKKNVGYTMLEYKSYKG